MGNLFDFCVEKNPHLAADDPRRKYKARVVLQGNRVMSQDWEAAMFQDLGNAPATMEASRSIDRYGCLPGHIEEQSDARQAYIQAYLNGDPHVGLPTQGTVAQCLATHATSRGPSP